MGEAAASTEEATSTSTSATTTTNTNGVVEPGQKCEIKALEERHNKQGELELIECGAFAKGSKERFEDYALVTKQVFNKDSTLRTANLQVNSPHILRILRKVVGVYSTQPAGFDVPITEEAPFALFYHYKAELARYEGQDEAVRQHHRILIDWIDAELGPVSADAEKLIAKGYITFPLLWTIFKTGELQFASHQGHPRLYRLDTAVYKETANKGQMFEVRCSYVDYNGTAVGRARETIQLFDRIHFTGKSPSKITSLPVAPRKFVGNEDLEAVLAARGQRMLEFKGILVMQYEGLLEYLKMPPYSWWGPACERDGVWTPISIAGRVVVDKKTFYEDFVDQSEAVEATDPPASEAQNVYLQSSAALSADDTDYTDPMLCPPFTLGYALDRKVWCRLFIDNLHPIAWAPDPMASLILPDTQKRLLRALVRSHVFPTQARDEWALKGKGLVILLHGTPGSGKTLTAETAAEYTHKALLKISLSELKDDERLEENMIKFQRYASTWQAIILIDEADVFLEARTSNGHDSAERNGLVAVFLRTLEYSQGIIFLTTNRITAFDAAIRSRVHLALQYRAPDTDARRQLWRQQLAGGEDALVEELARAPMNGREIANGIHTARTLAREEGGPLGAEQLRVVVRAWREFGAQLGEGGEGGG
ncbi:hypothetical protein MMC26_007357 [Xylographa opegraphella]|nr:hypothetical protein [Xylographa opegraphella]